MLFIGNIGVPEVIVILLLALLIFGPKKLPELGRSLGKGIREFRKGTSGLMESINEPPPAQPPAQPQAPAASVQTPKPAAQTGPSPTKDQPEEMVIDLEKEGNSNG
ncbi:MAG: twin-arginine translocase TatA/TatE family subunit [Acidobacteriota bacterium]|nr:twin-arginine translocase TatA/TatE family subunit [Acidobacteriota bacterium]